MVIPVTYLDKKAAVMNLSFGANNFGEITNGKLNLRRNVRVTLGESLAMTPGAMMYRSEKETKEIEMPETIYKAQKNLNY